MAAASPHTHSFVKACLISLSISLNFVVSEKANESRVNSIARTASAPPVGEEHAGLRELPSIVRVQRTTSGCPDKTTSFSRIGGEGRSAIVAHPRRRNDYGGGGAPRNICLHFDKFRQINVQFQPAGLTGAKFSLICHSDATTAAQFSTPRFGRRQLRNNVGADRPPFRGNLLIN